MNDSVPEVEIQQIGILVEVSTQVDQQCGEGSFLIS